MTGEEKERVFRLLSRDLVSFPVLPEDFREWGITTYKGARELMKEFVSWELAQGRAWIIEEGRTLGGGIAFHGRRLEAE